MWARINDSVMFCFFIFAGLRTHYTLCLDHYGVSQMARGGTVGVNWTQAENIIILLDSISKHFISLVGACITTVPWQMSFVIWSYITGRCQRLLTLNSREDENVWQAAQNVLWKNQGHWGFWNNEQFIKINLEWIFDKVLNCIIECRDLQSLF